MSTKTKNVPAASTEPKKAKGPMAIAFERIKALEERANPTELATIKAAIVELENRLDAPHECKVATLAAVPKKYMATGRVNFPSLGGLALPKGVGFHTFVDVEFEDVLDAKGVPYAPSREAITEKLKALADKQYPHHIGVVLCDVSVLPVGW